MADLNFSTKRVQIDKANASVVLAVGIASFVTISSLMFCRALLSQRSYQSKVIKAQNVAKDQLKENLDNVATLKVQYQAFAEQSQNIIGGNPKGTGDHDGDNAKIILDALPSKYDFPALATSLDKLLTTTGIKVNGISGKDDEVAQSQNNEITPVEIPVDFSVSGSYDATKNFISTIERSIRPIKINKVNFSGKESDLSVGIGGVTFYQPAKTVNIQQVEVKP